MTMRVFSQAVHHRRPIKSNAERAKAGRMYIDGKNIRNPDGSLFVHRGFNWGHGELIIDTDAVEDVSWGCNSVRFEFRNWGLYGGLSQDMQQIGAPGNLRPEYADLILRTCEQVKLAGMKLTFNGDSNCGQSGLQSPEAQTYCMGENFWTPGGYTQRMYFYETWQWLARRLLGLIDFYEPVVEPFAIQSTAADIWQFQTEVREIIKAEDPYALFIIGGNAYQVPSLNTAMNPAWLPENNTILTADCLSGVVTGGAFGSKLDVFDVQRQLWGCPTMCNQLGDTTADDHDDSLLAAAMYQCNNYPTGSIGYSVWEKVSQGPGSFGVYSSDVVGGPRTLKPNRRDVCIAGFAGPKIAA